MLAAIELNREVYGFAVVAMREWSEVFYQIDWPEVATELTIYCLSILFLAIVTCCHRQLRKCCVFLGSWLYMNFQRVKRNVRFHCRAKHHVKHFRALRGKYCTILALRHTLEDELQELRSKSALNKRKELTEDEVQFLRVLGNRQNARGSIKSLSERIKWNRLYARVVVIHLSERGLVNLIKQEETESVEMCDPGWESLVSLGILTKTGIISGTRVDCERMKQ